MRIVNSGNGRLCGDQFRNMGQRNGQKLYQKKRPCSVKEVRILKSPESEVARFGASGISRERGKGQGHQCWRMSQKGGHSLGLHRNLPEMLPPRREQFGAGFLKR